MDEQIREEIQEETQATGAEARQRQSRRWTWFTLGTVLIAGIATALAAGGVGQADARDDSAETAVGYGCPTTGGPAAGAACFFSAAKAAKAGCQDKAAGAACCAKGEGAACPTKAAKAGCEGKRDGGACCAKGATQSADAGASTKEDGPEA